VTCGPRNVRLGDVCEYEKRQGLHRDLPYVGLEQIESGTGRYLGGTEGEAVKSATFLFSSEHVLYGRLRPYLNKVLLPSFVGHCSTEIFPILCKGEVVREYLFYWLLMAQTVRAIDATCTGARMPRANMDAVLDLAFPLMPRVEQQRIVALLDEAFKGIATATANTQKSLQNARELLNSRAQELLAGDKHWERVQLADLLERGWITSHLDGNHGSDYPRKEEFVDSGVTYIAASAIKDGVVDFGEAKYLTPERARSIRKGLAKNRDVLFAHNATVGPVAVLNTDEDFVILGTSLTYYRCNPERIQPEYLAQFMLSPAFTSQYEQVMKQSTRNQVPITKQREFFHAIPPLDVQREITAELEQLSAQTKLLTDIYSRKLAALDELKQSLLHQAFSGAL
jgi:type I restriction enzyme S subunit